MPSTAHGQQQSQYHQRQQQQHQSNSGVYSPPPTGNNFVPKTNGNPIPPRAGILPSPPISALPSPAYPPHPTTSIPPPLPQQSIDGAATGGAHRPASADAQKRPLQPIVAHTSNMPSKDLPLRPATAGDVKMMMPLYPSEALPPVPTT